MSLLDQQIRRHQEALSAVLQDLLSRDAGLPRPVIGLDRTMPLLLPVRERGIAALRKLVEGEKPDFAEAALEFHIHPNENAAARRVVTVPYPYRELTTGDRIVTLEDGTGVHLAKLVVADVPDAWRADRPLDLVIQARSGHRRYGEALAVSPTINLRVPRVAIRGKETGI